MKPLLVCSNSTKNLLTDFERVRVVSSAPDISILDEMGTEESVTAIGGGAVIDTAKILSKNPIHCYPTTAAGSSATSWSVYWDGTKKCSLKRMKPNEITMHLEFAESLPYDMVVETTYDVVSHCLDSVHSKKKVIKSLEYCYYALELIRNKKRNYDLIRAGHIAGKAIEITGTNLLHSLSYPLTGHYGISHGTALGYFIPRISELHDYDVSDIVGDIQIELDINIRFVITEALKYSKIHESEIYISKGVLLEVLK